MSMNVRFMGACLVALCSVSLAGCGGGSTTFDPVQHDMEVIFSDADLETRRKASRNLAAGQSFTDEQIQKLMAYVKDDTNDDVIRARIVYALGTMGPDLGNHLVSDMIELREKAPSGSSLKHALGVAIDRLSWKQ